MNLFQICDITLNSGQKSDFKIECDALQKEDWECLAQMASKKIKFKEVVSVPTGGDIFAECLQKYSIDDDNLPIVICDDVLTTGGSMERKKAELTDDNIIGIVAFARGECPDWIQTIFKMD